MPVFRVILVLLLALCWSSTALAEPVVSVYTNGRGGFTLMANNLDHVMEAEVRIDYLSDDPTPPRVSGAGLGGRATIEVQADNPGSLTIRLKSSKPMSGYVLLATAQIQGTVTFLNAWLRNDKGVSETPGVMIANPTDEQLGAMAARRPASKAPVAATPVARAPVPTPAGAVAPSPVPFDASASTARSSASDLTTMPFSRRRSVLELLRAYSGERTPDALARLFLRSDGMFSQDPPVLISDGIASLRLTVRADGPDERTPLFFLVGGNCTGLKVGDDGAWILEIIPEQGTLAASVTVRTGRELIEFPLAVAPPRELFDEPGAGPGVVEYVESANWLAAGGQVSK